MRKPPEWQLQIRPAIDGARRGVRVFAFCPGTAEEKTLTLWRVPSYRGATGPGQYARRLAIALDRLLNDEGLSIADARERLVRLLQDRGW
jgi:hypothetical protein